MRTPIGYRVCAEFKGWDVVIHLPTLGRNLRKHGRLKLKPRHHLYAFDNPNEQSSLLIGFDLTDPMTGKDVQSTTAVRNGELDEILFDVETPKVAVDGCTITGGQLFVVQTEETIALGKQVQASLDRLIIEARQTAKSDDGLSEEPNGSSPAQITENGSNHQEHQVFEVARNLKGYRVCARFRGRAVIVHLPTLIENLVQFGYPKLRSWHQLLVPANPVEPSTLYLIFHLVFRRAVQSFVVVRNGVTGQSCFEADRPSIAVDGYTLTGYQMLHRVETDETFALYERLRPFLEELIVAEGMKNPRITTAIL